MQGGVVKPCRDLQRTAATCRDLQGPARLHTVDPSTVFLRKLHADLIDNGGDV